MIYFAADNSSQKPSDYTSKCNTFDSGINKLANSILVSIISDPSKSKFQYTFQIQPVAAPFVLVLVQPAAKETRYRYEREGRSSIIVGVGSTADVKMFPTIQVMNYFGLAVVVVSCVTVDYPYK